MNHESAEPLLSEWRLGMISSSQAEQIGDHVRGCGDCRSLLETLDAIAAALPAEGGQGAGHLSSVEIARAGMKAGPLPDEARFHLAGCSRCEEEVRLVREAEDTIGHARGRRITTRWWPGLIAAGLMTAILAWPAWLGLVREPEPWSGPVALIPLPGGVRSDQDSVPRFSLRPEERFLSFAVEVPELGDESGSLEFAIRPESGEVSWTDSFTQEQVRDLTRASGFLVVVVATDRFHAGRYSWTLAGQRADRQEILVRGEIDLID